MIGKGKSIAHTRASVAYGMKQEKEFEVILKEFLSGDNPSEIAEEFRLVQEQNQRCTKNTLSFVLSPTIEDGKGLDTEDLKEITKRFMEAMQLQDRQAIAFVHRNREHTHIHLYVNRIDFHGKAYKDNYIGKRSQLAAEKVARDMGLSTARDIQELKLEELKGIRSEIKAIHDKVFGKSSIRSFDTYIAQMQQKEVHIEPYINKQGALQGFRFQYKGHDLKGSAVHRSLSAGNIAKQMNLGSLEVQRIKKDRTILISGKTLSLSPNLATTIVKKALKLALKKVRSASIEL